MEQYYGMTAEMYRAVVALVDDRMKEIRVVRRDYDRLVQAQARTEKRLEELAAAQARTEKRVEELAAAQARTEKRVEELAAAQARTEKRVEELAEAQARTEKRVEELAAAQARTEKRVEELAAAQARTEKRVEELAAAQARTEKRLEELAAAQARTEERLTRLEATVERLAEAQARTEERLTRLEATVERLAEAQARTEERVDRQALILERLTSLVERLDSQVADLRGWQLEQHYRQRAQAYFGAILRKTRVVPLTEIEDELEAKLPREELIDLLELDLLVQGWPRKYPESSAVWLAVEVSGVVDWHDIARAQRRADALRRAGYLAIPAAAGKQATDWIKEQAFEEKVLLLEDGHVYFWDEALKQALSAGPSPEPSA